MRQNKHSVEPTTLVSAEQNNTFSIISLRETALSTLPDHRYFMGLHSFATFIFVSS